MECTGDFCTPVEASCIRNAAPRLMLQWLFFFYVYFSHLLSFIFTCIPQSVSLLRMIDFFNVAFSSDSFERRSGQWSMLQQVLWRAGIVRLAAEPMGKQLFRACEKLLLQDFFEFLGGFGTNGWFARAAACWPLRSDELHGVMGRQLLTACRVIR